MFRFIQKLMELNFNETAAIGALLTIGNGGTTRDIAKAYSHLTGQPLKAGHMCRIIGHLYKESMLDSRLSTRQEQPKGNLQIVYTVNAKGWQRYQQAMDALKRTTSILTHVSQGQEPHQKPPPQSQTPHPHQP